MSINKKRFFGFLRVIIFLTVFLLFFQAVLMTFVPKSVSTTYVPKAGANSSAWTSNMITAYIGERRNSIDILLVGNSNLYRGFSPIDCWNSYGISSCDCARPLQSPPGAYTVLVDALRYQSPKVIVLETDLLFPTHRTISLKTALLPDIKSVNTETGKDIAKIASSLKDLPSANDNLHFIYKGFIVSKVQKPFEGGFKYMTVHANTPVPLKPGSLQFLNETVALCKQKNIKLVLLSIPSAKSWSISKHNAVAEYARVNKLEFIDYNLNKKNNIGFNWLKDTYDGGTHLNIYGAHKVALYFGKYLKEKFQPADHRGDPVYAQWAEDLKQSYLNNAGTLFA